MAALLLVALPAVMVARAGRRQTPQESSADKNDKKPDGDTSTLRELPVTDPGKGYAEASEDFRFAAAVASFAMLLRDSPFKGEASYWGVDVGWRSAENIAWAYEDPLPGRERLRVRPVEGLTAERLHEQAETAFVRVRRVLLADQQEQQHDDRDHRDGREPLTVAGLEMEDFE